MTQLNEKIIMDLTEAKINKLYFESVLSETTRMMIQGLSMGYRPAEIVKYMVDQGRSVTLNQCNVVKFRYKHIIKEARKEFEDLVRIHKNQQKANGGKS